MSFKLTSTQCKHKFEMSINLIQFYEKKINLA